MKYVAQRESWDCSVAALAMATGLDYDTVRSEIEKRADIKEFGVGELICEEWLYRRGFAWQRIYRVNQLDGLNAVREEWPAQPWAPTHLVRVVATDGYHAVAMDDAGRVFDPWKQDRTTLSHPDYRDVNFIMGIWPVRQADK